MIGTFAYVYSVFKNSLLLSSRNYLGILPLIVVINLLVFGIHWLFPSFAIDKVNTYAVVPLALDLGLNFMLQIMLLFILYHNYRHENFKYDEVMIKGVTRLIPLLIAIVIAALPLIIALGLILWPTLAHMDTSGYTETMINVMKITVAISYILGILFAIAGICIFVYFYLTQVIVVCVDPNPIHALKQSWGLVRGNWWKTALLFLVIYLITLICRVILTRLVGTEGFLIFSSFIILPITCSVMVIHYQNLLAMQK